MAASEPHPERAFPPTLGTAHPSATDQDLLWSLASEHEDPEVRSAAAMRINDDRRLAILIHRESDLAVMGAAVSAIGDQAILHEIAGDEYLHHHPRVMAILLITDRAFLDELQHRSPNRYVHSACRLRLAGRTPIGEVDGLATWAESNIEYDRRRRSSARLPTVS